MASGVASALYPPPSSERMPVRKSDLWFQGGLLVLALGVEYFLQRGAVTGFQSFGDIGKLLAAVVIAMLVHESGHLLAAHGLGFQFLGASFGPWRLQTLHGKRKTVFEAGRIFTASISAAPRQLDGWRLSMMIVVIAGPAATLLCAACAFCLLHQQQIPDPVFCGFLLQVNLLLFVLALVPNAPYAHVRNDARLLLMLWQTGRYRDELELSVQLTLLVLKGVRPRDYSPQLLSRLSSWRGRPESELIFAQAMVRWAIDSDEFLLADYWDAHAVTLSEQCDFAARNQALASSACMDVLFRDDLEAATNKFVHVNTRTLFPKCFEYRARAAKYIAVGHGHKAPAEIIRAQYSLPKGIVAYDLERKLLENLHLRVLLKPQAENLLSNSVSCGA